MRPPTATQSAFTYVEILVALLVVALLVGAVCSALIATLRAEETSRWMTEAQFIIVKLSADHELGASYTGAVAVARSSWHLEENTVEVEQSKKGAAWTLVALHPQDRPSLSIEVAFDATGRNRRR